MRIHSLVTLIEAQTDDKLRERLRIIRHTRSVERPAYKAKVKEAVRKESRKKVSAIDKLIAGLSPEEVSALLEQLGEQA